MELLLCAATPFEIQPAVAALQAKGIPVRVLITGVGLPETMYTLTKAVTRERPDLMLQAGVAGSLRPDLTLGSVVAVDREAIGDLGVEEDGRFVSVRKMSFAKQGYPWQDQFLPNPGPLPGQCGLKIVNAVSVNEISTLNGRLEYYRNGLDAAVESMEGAAFHYIGLMENISFLQIRAISNFAGERNKQHWQMETAISALNKELVRIIQNCVNA